ncbi:class I SAM-dependent methyltransferase [Nocardioides campestrisoli]|uniref:class I SAM-dependent methyltransferase n=1 Tax=Nocardioides campestrisoli TaxID=2736757 RepID=UPI0015E68371|nr:class I SAM-dependent methyltransferase [Nocardioides campestrisoli]
MGRTRREADLPRVLEVDATGVTLSTADDRAVDVLFGDQRVWSFWVRRDTEPDGSRGRRRVAAWPEPLRKFLDGRTTLTVRDSASGTELWRDEVSFGDSREEIRVVNRRGVAVGMDKSGRLVPTFDSRDGSDIESLVDATEEVLGVLAAAGAEPFLAYGTLLGAVREGRVLGHDSDADVAYVSRYADPVDVCRESFRLQREVVARGYATQRYSGAAFKIEVPEGEGVRGLDVFGGFLSGGRLYLMGEVGVEFEREWLYPLGTAMLEGRSLPVPARPEKLLEAMYGPSWEVPDPAFQFTTPERTSRALNDWFRGLRVNEKQWQRRYLRRFDEVLTPRASKLARLTAEHAAATGAQVVDVGAGSGRDGLWLAREGLDVLAYDYVPEMLERAEQTATSFPGTFRAGYLNLAELRSVLSEGARLARDPRPRVVMARNLLDAVDGFGRQSFARFCSMILREGGLVLAEFHVSGSGADREWRIGTVDAAEVEAAWRAAGATRVTWERDVRGGDDGQVDRLVAEWGP